MKSPTDWMSATLPQVLALHHSTEARADGVEIDDVRDIKDGLRIVLDARGRPLLEAVVVIGRATRPGKAHVHPHRGGAGAAVEGDDERTLAEVGDPVLRVPHVEHLGHYLALVADGDPSGLPRCRKRSRRRRRSTPWRQGDERISSRQSRPRPTTGQGGQPNPERKLRG